MRSENEKEVSIYSWLIAQFKKKGKWTCKDKLALAIEMHKEDQVIYLWNLPNARSIINETLKSFLPRKTEPELKYWKKQLENVTIKTSFPERSYEDHLFYNAPITFADLRNQRPLDARDKDSYLKVMGIPCILQAWIEEDWNRTSWLKLFRGFIWFCDKENLKGHPKYLETMMYLNIWKHVFLKDLLALEDDLMSFLERPENRYSLKKIDYDFDNILRIPSVIEKIAKYPTAWNSRYLNLYKDLIANLFQDLKSTI